MNLISAENIKYVPKAGSMDIYITESEEIHTHTQYNNIYNVLYDNIYHFIPIMIYIMASLVKTNSIESNGSAAGGKGWILGQELRSCVLCNTTKITIIIYVCYCENNM